MFQLAPWPASVALVPSALVIADTPSDAQAIDLTGKVSAQFRDRDGTDRDSAKANFTKQLDVVAPLPDPVCPADSSIAIRTNHQTETFVLDCSAWSNRRGKLLRYKPTRGSGDPITKVMIGTGRRGGKIQVQAKGEAYGASAIGGPVDWVEVEINVAGTTYCGRLESPVASIKRNEADRVQYRGMSTACSAPTEPEPNDPNTPDPNTPDPNTPPAPVNLPELQLITPSHGGFTNADTINVTGQIQDAVEGMLLEVNGIGVVPNGDSFSVDLPVDPNEIVQKIIAKIQLPDGRQVLDRVDVIFGDLVGGDLEDGFRLRLNDHAVENLRQKIEALLRVRLGGYNLIPNNGYLINFNGPPIIRIGVQAGPTADVAVNIIPEDGYISTDLILTAFTLGLQIEVGIPSPIPGLPDATFNCNALQVTVGETTISSEMTIEPNPGGDLPIEVTQLASSVNVRLGNLGKDSAFCGGIPIDFSILGLTDLLQDLLLDAFGGDQVGEIPLADIIEEAFNGIDIAANFIESISLNAQLNSFDEDTEGMSLSWDTTFLPDDFTRPDGAPLLPGSFDPGSLFPGFGDLTPSGDSYDVGIGLALATLNQLLQANTEAGALLGRIEELHQNGGALPFDTTQLAQILPGLDLTELLGADIPLAIVLSPTHHAQVSNSGDPYGLAPLLSGLPGPYGTAAELILSYWRFDLVRADTGEIVFEGVIDARLGVDFRIVVDESGNPSVDIHLTGADINDVALMILANELGIEETQLRLLLALVFDQLLPLIEGGLGEYPVPNLDGLDLEQLDVELIQNVIRLFANAN